MKIKAMIWALLGLGFGAFGQEIPATKVTMSLSDVSLNDAIKQISEQTGNPITLQVQESGGTSLKRVFGLAPANRVTLEAKDQPFWNVMLDLCEKNKLELQKWRPEGGPKLLLTQGEPEKLPTCMRGACMIQIVDAEVNMRQDFRSKVDKGIGLHMNMWFEPKSGVFKYAYKPIIEQAMTEQGVSLAPANKNDEPRFTDLTNPVLQTFYVNLDYKPDVKSLKTFSGKVWVIQEVKSEEWVIEMDKAPGETKTICDLDTLKITGVMMRDNSINLMMEIASGTSDESLLSYNQMAMRIKYEGYENKPGVYTNVESASTRRAGNKTVMTCTFNTRFQFGINQLPPKLTIRVPAEVKAVQIPFEFHDLELP